jgi:hypothetical protein
MQSGVGWNDSELKLQAEPHLWENLEKVSFPTLVVTIYSTLVVIRSRIRRFRGKSFPLYESLVQLYEGNNHASWNNESFLA